MATERRRNAFGLLRVSAGLALLALASCSPPEGQKRSGPAAAGQGGSQMAALQLSITPEHAELIVGESFPVQVTLTNAGDEPIEVHSPQGPSELQYVLRPIDDEAGTRVLSAREARAARSPDSVVPVPEEMAQVEPAGKLDYQADLASYAIEPLAAGNYELSVRYQLGEDTLDSPTVPVVIARPQVLAMAIVRGLAMENLAMVFAHEAKDGAAAIFQRESRRGAPGDGMAFRRGQVDPPLAVRGVATAIDMDRMGGGRWYAWVQDDALVAGVAEYETVFVQVEPQSLGVSEPRLLPVGWQPTAESAVFVALGTGPDGKAALAAAMLEATGDADVKTVPLAATDIPAQWAAQYRPEDPTPQLDVVWADAVGDGVQVRRQTVRLGDGSADAAETLLETDRPLAALALDPIAGEAPGLVDVLLGPAGQETELTLARLPLAGGATGAKWAFAAPEDPDGRKPTAWALSSAATDEPVVLAKLGDRLLVRRMADGADWDTLAEDAAGAEHIRLVALDDGAVWAVWANPTIGIRYEQVP